MAETDSCKFHIAMFPWFAIGHLTPYLHFSNELAKRGHKITFLIPKKTLLQLQHLNQYPHLITFHSLTVPHVEGLPQGTETASEIPFSLNNLLAEAMDLTRDQVELALIEVKPDFVFYDSAHWLPEIARKNGIKSISYNVVSAAVLGLVLVPARFVPKDRPITVEEVNQPPPGFPSSKVVLRGHEPPSVLFLSKPFGKGITFYERVTTAMKESDAIAIRTCRELEGKYCDYLAEQYKKPVLLSGPVLPEKAEGELEERWAKWLNGFEPGSVVFCAFGSQPIDLEKAQFQEILLGFELTGLPFLVSLKPPNRCASVELAFPVGFEERVKGKGVVSGDWVQQPLILNHPSVGCFVSHCGFGSMWESLMSDNQIVLVPHLGDQIINTRLLVEELKVAVEVQKEENGWVSRENLSKAIKLVLDKGSQVSDTLKKNHAKWKETFASPGFMNGYVDRFMQNLHELLNK